MGREEEGGGREEESCFVTDNSCWVWSGLISDKELTNGVRG